MDAASLSEIESNPTLTYRFGPYMLDVGHRRLLSGSNTKILPEKILQILVMLLEAKCRVVERREFFDCLWPDEPVGDATLSQHMANKCLVRSAGANQLGSLEQA
jgi:DNA-binding winged helix-turn-helix (wHTH) protein